MQTPTDRSQPRNDGVPQVHAAPRNPRRDQRLLVLVALTALGLTAIGVRFLASPDRAAVFYGLIPRPNGFQLHTVIALRDIWLGLLALGLVWLRQWPALALWLALGALVSFGDAGIVYGANGRARGLLFHMASGLMLTILAALAYRRAVRDQSSKP
jgi:Domain of unknown function (DUF4267)